MSKVKIICSEECDCFDSLDEKALGIVEIDKLGINCPETLIIPGKIVKTLIYGTNEEKNKTKKYIFREIKAFVNCINNDLKMFSLRCACKKINGVDKKYPESVLNIGFNVDLKEVMIKNGYDKSFIMSVEKTFIKTYTESLKSIDTKDNNIIDQNLMKQIEIIIYSIINYFKKYHNNALDEKKFTLMIQRMVFGNLNSNSLNGMCYTRNPYNGKKEDYGRFFTESQGFLGYKIDSREILDITVMKKYNSSAYYALKDICKKIEENYNDIRYIEYTVQGDEVYILQNTIGNRTYIISKKERKC